MKLKPLNGNVLVEPLRNQTEKIFAESDSRKDLQYALVRALPPDPIILMVTEDKVEVILKVGDKVVYNPRSLTVIVVKDEALGMVHERNLIAVE